jgi:hypothetical protein
MISISVQLNRGVHNEDLHSLVSLLADQLVLLSETCGEFKASEWKITCGEFKASEWKNLLLVP